MEFQSVLERIAEGLLFVDRTSTIINSSNNGIRYLPGLPTLYENQCAVELMNWWKTSHPEDFQNLEQIQTSYPYPNNRRNMCDIVFSTDGRWPVANNSPLPEWAIELKKIVFVGDNGKNNDYGPSKFLSPFLKDRSLSHDVGKLQEATIARKKAVIGYGFNYDPLTLEEARLRFPEYSDRIDNAIDVCQRAGMENNSLHMRFLLDIAEIILERLGKTSPLVSKEFSNAWRHPLGGNGVIFGWEVLELQN